MGRTLTRALVLTLAAVVASSAPLVAQASPGLSTTFTSAEGTRTYMDVGGVWNGTGEVTATTGDTFTLTATNNGPGTAHDLGLSVALPAGFQYVTGTISGASGIAASQVGTTLTVTIPAATTILSTGQLPISFGLTTGTTVTGGSKTITYTFSWADSPSGTQNNVQTQQAIVVQPGASTIEITPNDQLQPISATATWDVTVTNTGLGGLFDVEVDESALGASSSLTLTGMTQTAPAMPTAAPSSPILTLPYLAPGEQFVVQVTATVVGCENIDNTVATDDRTGATTSIAGAQVTLDLTDPMLSVTPPTIPLNYGAPVAVVVGVQNTGPGEARSVSFAADFGAAGLTVSNVTGGWSFSSGTFTYTANSGTIGPGAMADISFQVEQTNPCSGAAAGTVVWFSSYQNACGQSYSTPTELQSISAPADAPSVGLACSGEQRLEVNEASQWVLTLSASNTQNISTDPLVVTNVLPAGITGVTVGSAPPGTSSSCTGGCGAGDTLTWTVPLSALSGGPLQLQVNYTAPSDPCLGGTFLTNTASMSATDTAGCPISETGQSQTLLINNPGGSVLQTFNIASTPDGYYETGAADNGNATRDAGEGEFLPFTAQFGFPGGSTGTWAGSTYEDDFGMLSDQALVGNTVLVSVNGGSTQAVPSGSITLGTGTGFSNPGITIDLTFMNQVGFAGTSGVAGHAFELTYMTTVADAALPNPSHQFVQRSTLNLANGNSGCTTSGATFTLGAFVPVARAAATLGVSMPSVIDVCETFAVTFTVGNDTVEDPSFIRLTIDTTGDYEYVAPQVPVYGGIFNSGNITYAENGGSNPTFTLTPSSTELTANGTVTVQVRRKSQTTTSTTAIQGSVEYDDNETEVLGNRAFSTNGSASPALVQLADLQTVISPQLVNVISNQAQWVVYGINGGNGSTYDTALRITVPSGLTPNKADTDAANPGAFPVTVVGQVMTWDLASIGNGQTQPITVVCDVAGTACTIPTGTIDCDLEWGCGGTLHQTSTVAEPNFVFPSGQIQALHDTSETQGVLCGTGRVEIIVRNTGIPYVQDLVVSEALDPTNSGIDIVPGTVEWKRNTDATWTSGSNPSGAGNPYSFSSTEIPPLLELAPQAVSGGVFEVRIRFDVSSSELANTSSRSVGLSVSGKIPCGNAASSVGETFIVPLAEPSIDVTTTGRNVTAGELSFSNTVHGTDGDQIEWRVVVQNNGTATAQHARLTSTLAPSGGGNFTITGTNHSSGTSLPSGGTIDLPDLGIGAGETYLVTETLGGTCVDGTFSAAATWGCVNNGLASPSNLNSPGNSSDPANLRMLPAFSGSGIAQSFTPLAGGRMQVAITLTNAGGRAESIVLTDTLPPGLERDTTHTVGTPTGSSSITGVSVGGSLTVPTFTLNGTLRNGESTTVTFRTIPTAGFDTTSHPFTNPETVANGFDPAVLATANNTVVADYESGCSTPLQNTDNTSLDPASPDLDIAVSPSSQVVADGAQYTFDYTITNNGDTGSIADGLLLTPTLGAGWTSSTVEVTTAGTGGSVGVCAGGICNSSDLGTLSAGQSAVVRVTATANDGGALTMSAELEGSLLASDGSDTGNDYSLDVAQVQVIGFASSMTLVSTTEPETTGSEVAIGEDQTWRLRVRMFGGTPLSNIVVRNTLPTGLGYVDHTATGSNTATISGVTLNSTAVTGSTPVDPGQLDFALANLSTATFEVDVIARTLNVAGNTQNQTLENNLGASVLADFGSSTTMTFASSDPDDGFGGSEASLHADGSATVKLPDPTFETVVRNVTTSSSFGELIMGQAGDVIEYRTTITNDGQAPLFDIAIGDVPVDAELLVIDGNSDGIDNDGDGLIDGSDPGGEGTYTAGSGGSIAFADADTQLTLGNSLARLDPGNTVTLLYRATLDAAVVPDDMLVDASSLAASTLSGANGGQTVDPGTPGTASGERTFSDTNSATVEVVMIALSKSVDATSTTDSTGNDVFIGEQIRFELSVVLPAGQVPALQVTDSLPIGLSLIATPAVTIGSAISGSGSQPTITPSSLPASGSPLAITWDFGTRNVSTGSSTDRTVTITYLAQVENVVGNVGTGGSPTQLTNSASYSFTGSSANSSTVTLTVRETDLTITQVASPTGVVDAGQIVTYTVTVTNPGSVPAYDLDLRTTLPAGLTYVASSTTPLSGPTIGEPATSGQNVTWGRSQTSRQNIDLSPSQTLQYTYQVLVGDGVEPDELLQDQLTVDWTSLDGNPGPDLGVAVATAGAALGERTGSAAGANSNSESASASTTISNVFTTDSSLASGDTVGSDGFRIGDLVTYTIQVSLQEGTVDSFQIRDTLPSGLSFFDAQAISPASGINGFTFTQPTGANAPTAGQTGTLAWNLGTVVNAGDNNASNDSLTLVYRARIEDDAAFPATPTTTTVSNQSQVTYEDVSGNAEATLTASDSISIKQPLLAPVASLRTATTTGAGETVGYRITVTNNGDAPAYNAEIRDFLPAGMRATAPTLAAATLGGSGISLGNPSFNSSTGETLWTLPDAIVIQPGQSLVIDYDTTVDTTVGGGLTLTHAPDVARYFSKPSADLTERREYATQGATAQPVTTPTPTDMDKAADVATANIGEVVTFTLTAPATPVDVTLYDLNVLDAVDGRLRVTSITDNSSTLGTTTSTGSSGNPVDVVFAAIPPLTQAVVTVTAVVEDQPATTTATTIPNQASFTWAQAASGSAQTAINSGSVNVEVTEPDLGVVKVFKSQTLANPAQGLQAGDTVTFTITVTNTGDGDAHDFVLRDVGDDELINPVVTANPDNPGAPASSIPAGSTIVHTWNTIAGPIASGGGTYQFDITFTIANTVQPFQNMDNNAEVDWHSTPAPNPDRRGPATGYAEATDSAATATAGTVSMTKVDLGDGTYSIGDEITYRLTATIVQGQVSMVRILDDLPTGLEFVSATLTPTDVQLQGGGTVVIASGPSAGATGTIDFDIGDIESNGPNPRLQLDVIARVQDVPSNTNATNLTNAARTRIEFPSGSGMFSTINAQTNPQVTIEEPAIVLGLDAPTTVELGTPAALVARLDNTGPASAFQPTLIIELPADMRDTDPTTLPLVASIAGGRTLTLIAGTDFTTNWDSGTGRLTVSLTSANGYVAGGETLTVAFEGALDPDAADGVNLALVATATTYSSQDQSGGPAVVNREYSTAFGTGTLATANGAIGDDPSDGASLIGAVPVIVMTKAVDLAAADPGDILHYTIVVNNSGAADATGVVLTDDLAAAFAAGTLANVTITPSGGTNASDPNGGTASSGVVSVSGLTVPASTSLTVEFDVQLEAVLPNATIVTNQATLSVNGFPNPFLSDSTRAADDDGIETGNDPGDPNDDDPTRTLIGSMPVLEVDKTAADDDGGSLLPGDTIVWTMTIRNSGNEESEQTTLTDPVPANTTYVAGSTTLNGAPVADVGGQSPLLAGLQVSSPAAPAGRLLVGQPATVSFRVTVSSAAATGSIVSNQATVEGRGEGTSTLAMAISDDPATTTAGDPTSLVVGDGPALRATKTALDENGSPLQPSEFVTYTISIENVGNAETTGTILTDAIPGNAAFVPGSIELDIDGPGPGGFVTLTDALDGDAGDFGSTTANAITVHVSSLAASASATVRFRVQIDSGAALGAVVANQGSVASTELPTIPTDADGNGNNGAQPTNLVVGNIAAVQGIKSLADLDGGTLDPGDTIRFTIALASTGAQDATNVVLTDALPLAFGSYVPNSTTVDGIAIADDAGPTSPLLAGLSLGTLPVGTTRTVSVEMVVDALATPGTVISNQASFVADGSISGTTETVTLAVGGAPGSAVLCGYVWLDIDHDRVRDPNEPVQQGWGIEVLRNGSIVATTTSGADGFYEFQGLLPGSGYEVRFRHPTTNVVYGGAVSSAPGASVVGGTITNLTLASGSLTLEQSLPIDPSGVFYNAVTREPISGVNVTLTGPPGFDPLVHLLPGQAQQTTDATGFYRFDLTPSAPPGVYTIQPIPPTGFLPNFPSSIIPPLAGPLDPTGMPDPLLVSPQNTAPQTGEPTDYYISFDLAVGDPNVVNNHIALDPILEGAVVITKTTPKTDVVRGELVPYEITFRNTVTALLPQLDLIDVIPPGFKYVSGSAMIDGVPAAPLISGRTLRWANLSLQSQQERTLRLLLVIGAGANLGNYMNRVHAIEPSSATMLSNVATATVRIVPDPLFDGSDVIGKVFDDKNGNGSQDLGEPGMPGVRLVTARGLVVQTDEFGRYHVTDPLVVSRSRGANFIIKLDVRTLPTGYRMTTENPRVVRLTRGKITKANFGIARMRVVRVELSGDAFDERNERRGLRDDVWRRIEQSFEQVCETPSLVRLAYVWTDEPRDLVDARVQRTVGRIQRAWSEHDDRPPLTIEREVVRATVINGNAATPLGETITTQSLRGGRIDVLPNNKPKGREDYIDPSNAIRLRIVRLDAPAPAYLGITAEQDGEDRVRFTGFSTFPALVKRADVVVTRADSDEQVTKLQLDELWQASWRIPGHGASFRFTLRTQLPHGGFAHTEFGRLSRATDGTLTITPPQQSRVDLGQSVASVRVDGEGATDMIVWVGGVKTKVDASGRFQAPILLPPGRHDVQVTLQDEHGSQRTIAQRVRISEGFRVGSTATGGEGDGKVVGNSRVNVRPIPPGAERSKPDSRSGRFVPPFRISVDGDVRSTEQLQEPDAQRATDLGLADMNIRVNFDGLSKKRRLNVTAWPEVAVRGEPVVFQSYTNYPAWIVRGEVRLHAHGTDAAHEPLATLAIDDLGRAAWLPQVGFGERVDYVLRVYDRDGRFDETVPRELPIVSKRRPVGDETTDARELLAGYGNTRIKHQAIPLGGGTVTVHGDAIPDGYSVRVDHRPVPVDERGHFVADLILSPGKHDVTVDVVDPDGRIVRFERPVLIPDEDWFYVALADLTLASQDTSGPGAELLSESAGRDDVYLDGRVALYLKGKIKGDWLLTAMVDSGEEALDDLLRNIDEKDPRQLLRRLDPDRYYYVYGDDSTTTWDAPTMGKFYVRLERGPTHVMWGSFQTRILDTEFAQIDRALYGARLHWQTDETTKNGKPRVQVDAFAAEPETVRAREEFRGTGGSLYWLRNQDITIGSERVRVEVRDRDSGLVLETRNLVPFEDYDINYIQGRILLTEPLPTNADDPYTVRNASLAGQPVHLVVRYEYRPHLNSLDNLSIGGRFATALSDRLEFGITAGREEEVGASQDLVAADLTLRASPRTWVKFEVARTEGPGAGELFSADGGFAFGNVPLDTRPDVDARAYRAETAFNFRDIFGEDWKVDGAAYLERTDRGFSTPGRQTLADTYKWGFKLGADLTEKTRLDAKFDRRRMDFGTNTDAGHIDLRHKLTRNWSLQVGFAHENNTSDVGSPLAFEQGKRTDVGAQVEYDSLNDWKVHMFGQATVDRDSTRRDMSRGGVGGSFRISDRLTLGGELSGGATGLGAKVESKYRVNERTDTYLTYGLGTDTTAIGMGQRTGTITSGAKHRYSDAISLYGEERYRHGDGPEGLTHAYGVDYTPSDRWAFGLALEDGELIDPLGGSIERTSASLTGSYRHDGLRYGGALEYRDESFSGQDRETWLVRNNLAVRLSNDWRALSKVNFSVSNGAGGQFFDGDFVEASTGIAYRPVENDRWNWLLTYTYLADLPSPGQVTRAGGTLDFEQRSHVFAFDATYDLFDWMSVGGKYATRIGELRMSRTEGGEWYDSRTQLAILRVDWHAVSEWDVHVEGRWRDVDVARDSQAGALVGVYRHVSDNVRLGAGYNFTDFSDRLTDLRYDRHGFFVNLVAKF